jgi:cysteine desulfurase/selenocysteine lyase
VVITHGSNVTGAVQRVEEVGAALQKTNTLLLIDAAQTLGHWPVNVSELSCDLLAAPGHKGLLGPYGTGLLYVGPRAEATLHSTRQGGTGTQSEDDHQPEGLPERMEAGSLNLAGLAGLHAGMVYLVEQGVDKIARHGHELTALLLERLSQASGVNIFGPTTADSRLPVVSFQVQGYDPQEVAGMLDASAHVQARAGLHCAPLMHRRLDTLNSGGTVRFSLGPFNTEAEVETAAAAVAALAETA